MPRAVPNRTERIELYTKRAGEHAALAEQHGARSRLVSNLRGVAFATATISGLFAVAGSTPLVTAPISAVGALWFFVLVVWHGRVIQREDDARRWERVNQNALARVSDGWHELPDDGASFKLSGHPYADDLDVFGRGSLFQRLCTAHTHFGQQALATLLSEPRTVDESCRCQEAARALGPELDTRQKLEALAMAVVDPNDAKKPGSEKSKRRVVPDPEPLLKWAEGAPLLLDRPLVVWTARILPVFTLLGLALSFAFGLPAALWGVPLLIQLVVGFRMRGETTSVFMAVSSTEGAFLRYGPMLELLEGVDLPSTLLRRLREGVLVGKQRPSESMREFEKGLGWFELRHNGLIHPFVNALLLWDIHCVLRLERWQKRSGKTVREWFRALGQLEALGSLGAFAYDEPDTCWPEFEDGGAKLVAQGLAHPLISSTARVANDVNLPDSGVAMLVTGSNMSGKSTLLRAMGLAAVLAYAGAPVTAERLQLSVLAVRTSVRISDSLERGVSHFYAEIGKLKLVLDGARDGQPVLFLLDEILHGTNSRERQIGARWVLSELLRRGATGAVSTHDMELCNLTDELASRVELVHFRESVKGEEMTFDYKLREGPVTAGNALRLMQLVGLDVPLE